MIWLPVVLNLNNVVKFDWIFVDELQDFNKCQNELIKLICNEKTRVVGVGDKQQSIYLFRGAEPESMGNFKIYFNACEFPLSVSYRCPKKSILEAQKIYPEIEYADNAIDGVLENIDYDTMYSTLKHNDVILCRFNLPLFKVLFKLYKMGKKAIFKDKDIKKELYRCIDGFKDYDNILVFREQIRLYKDKLQEKFDDCIKKNNNQKYLLNKKIEICEIILFLSEDKFDMISFKNFLDSLFLDSNNSIYLNTVHGFKGKESDRIFILDYKNLANDGLFKYFQMSPKEIEQEWNIKYVALTRNKKELYLVDKNE